MQLVFCTEKWLFLHSLNNRRQFDIFPGQDIVPCENYFAIGVCKLGHKLSYVSNIDLVDDRDGEYLLQDLDWVECVKQLLAQHNCMLFWVLGCVDVKAEVGHDLRLFEQVEHSIILQPLLSYKPEVS